MLNYCRKFEDLKFNILYDILKRQCIFWGTPSIGQKSTFREYIKDFTTPKVASVNLNHISLTKIDSAPIVI